MRPVKLKPGTATDPTALPHLIAATCKDIKVRVEHG
jgi:hypothetical protein